MVRMASGSFSSAATMIPGRNWRDLSASRRSAASCSPAHNPMRRTWGLAACTRDLSSANEPASPATSIVELS